MAAALAWDRLSRHWFLLLLLGGLAVAFLWPEPLRKSLAGLEPRYIVAGALFLVACSLESRRLLKAVVRPFPALWATFVSFGPLPALVWLTGDLVQNADL